MVKLKVSGMTCGHCVQAVTKAVHGVAPGVPVEIDRESGQVAVAASVDRNRLVAAIAEAGFDAE
ncbi:copper chaperone CopZ [mine drainage metagenome]|uniref:Copper chaperone CopZ n=1 Tax=mine drainage metagenome TaxID=410659 RepID=A0A1J5P6M0_9ZZZZ